MKQILKCFFIASVYMLYSVHCHGQATIILKPKEDKKFELVSPLDLLYHPSDAKNVSIIKQRSIFDANKLPLFCKIEHKLSKKSNVNLRMRLGSLDYVNKLEGKN